MKQCNVFILGLSKYEDHKLIALYLMDRLKEIKTSNEEYKPYILLCDDSPQAIQTVIAEYTEKLGCDVLISPGYRITSILPTVYEVQGPLPTLFLGVADPMRLGIIKSLEKPGGTFSGVCMAEPNAEHYAEHYAEQLRLLHPYVKRIGIPYDPASLGGLVKKRADLLVGALRAVGFEVNVYEVRTLQDGLKVVSTHMNQCHAVLLVEGCAVAVIAERAIAYLCGMAGRLLLSSSGRMGIASGASFSYGGASNILLPEVIGMVRRFWRDRKPVGMQPVITVSNSRRLFVNRFRLPWLPRQIMQKIKNHTEINVVFQWARCPVNRERDDDG
jgi:hypothetical protein